MSSGQSYEGLCHCRAVGFDYRTAIAPELWPVRACQCTFCRSHGALSTSDTGGTLRFVAHVPDAFNRYQFGRRTADFLLCRKCGVYLGAVMRSERGSFGIINVRVLSSLLDRLPEPEPMNYDNEGVSSAKCVVKAAGRRSLSASKQLERTAIRQRVRAAAELRR